MKTLFTLFIVLTSAHFFSACQKEVAMNGGTIIHDTIRISTNTRDTIRIHDTVFINPPTILQNITEKTWEIEEMIRVDNGIISEYNKAGLNTTGTSFQNMKIKFNQDFSGSYTDENGGYHTLNWSFTNGNQTLVTLNVGAPYANTFKWRMMEIKGTHLVSSSVYAGGLISHRWIQIP